MPTTATFDELLNVFWLRPETALWREIDIRAMQGFDFKMPSLDLGCGDGVFSFIRSGGGFSAEFDAFQTLAGLNRFFENVDVFDAFDPRVSPAVTRPAGHRISFGFDHKANLLGKAGQLGIYESLKQGDANRKLPFADDSLKSVFSNVVYWLDDPQAVFKEVGRVLQPGGRACLMLPNRTFPEFSFYNQLYVKTKNPQWAFLEKLDRGRFADNIRQSRSGGDWEAMFKRAGLRVAAHKAHLSRAVVQAWDVGLRPLFPVLHRMARAVSPDAFPDIKREWIATLRQFLAPLADLDDSLSTGIEPAFHCYIVEK